MSVICIFIYVYCNLYFYLCIYRDIYDLKKILKSLIITRDFFLRKYKGESLIIFTNFKI